MTQRRHVAIIAGIASLLAIAPLTSIFESWGWLLTLATMLVVLIVGAAVTARALRAPSWAQPLITMGVLLLFLTSRFGEGALLGVLPTPAVFVHFNDLLNTAGDDIQQVAVPAPSRVALQFLTLLGVGMVTLLIDMLAVTLRRPALAGLPMLAIYSVPVAVIDTGVPVWPFVLGATGYLWLLVADNTDRVRRWGRRFSGDGKDIDAWEPSPMGAAGRRLGIASLAIAVALPLLVPSLGSGIMNTFGVTGDGTGPGNGSGNGSGSMVNPITQLQGFLMRNGTIEMARMTTDNPSPGYLKLAVADDVTESGFRPSNPHTPKALGSLPDPSQGMSADVKRQQHTASIEVHNLDTPYLLLYPRASTVDTRKVKGTWQYDPITGVAFSGKGSNARGAKYTQSYIDYGFTAEVLRRAPNVSPDDPAAQMFTKVPQNAYVASEVIRATQGASNQYDKVLGILNTFSDTNGFSYTLSTKPGTSGSLIEDFLKNKKGYCEQYASAMAWMVRQAGIPSRVVTGFTQGTQVPGSPKTWVVTNYNLHAWVEVYFTGFGWVPFDPTPSALVAGSVALPWAPDPSRPNPTPTNAGPSSGPVDDGDPTAPKGDTGIKDKDSGAAAGATPVKPAQWPYFLVGALVLLALLLTPATARILTRRRRLAWTSSADPDVVRRNTHQAWTEFGDLLTDYGLDSDAIETPRGLMTRLTGRVVGERAFAGLLTGGAAEGARLLATAEERARYAREPLAGEGIRAALGAVRAGLRDDSGRWVRISAVLMPPSTVERWRRATGNAGFVTVEWLARLHHHLTPRKLFRTR
ncbi:transglutaminase [Longispora fulva]|uniref:Transglutaminase-like putative cysteine protease n=1 Tax=Longispora fulva TaxID=619741 RepID=A0A8J7GIA3_9ACTN|nr:DUF3488 and transglutaminase-like domain-containing protein [Longispora fulva]MBG6141168.1 transglutaminase-like putative cysteine protease [Longispora fulva]GIG62836.1 transglutaminase [Longispora fulva]